jgi:hypothetical protein
MEITKTYDNYPLWIVFLSGSVSILVYVSGLIIISSLSWIAVVPYSAFILWLEFRLLSKHCINCYYWGKTCGFGKGRLSSWLFKRGNPSEFCDKSFSWKDMIPDLLVSLIPILTAVILMIIRFNFILLIVTVVLIALTTIGNGFIRGNLTCKFCKQREMGCPAQQLFDKK